MHANLNIDINYLYNFFSNLQRNIVSSLEELDGKIFLKDNWQKDNTNILRGKGSTQILEYGNIFEKAGVGFSCVEGDCLPNSALDNLQKNINLNNNLNNKKFNAF